MTKRRVSWAGHSQSCADTNKPSLELDDDQDLSRRKHLAEICKLVGVYCQQYTDNSSLHGVRYIGEKHRTLLERIIWTIILLLSIVACSFLILNTWNKWNHSPVIVSFSHKPTAVWQIPFPAVTICPEIKSRQCIFNYTKSYKMYEANDFYQNISKEFSAISLLCNFFVLKRGEDLADENTLNFIFEAAPRFNETFLQCTWNSTNEACSDMFRPILTEEGLCYTFNMLDSSELFTPNVDTSKYSRHGRKSDWSLDSGYSAHTGPYGYPVRALGVGHEASFKLLLNAYEQDFDYLCRGAVQGFKLLLHNPAEIPRVSQKYLRIPVNQELTVGISPEMSHTSNGLRPYSPLQRHCYFQNERYLHFYNVYTAENCLMECLTNYTLHKCDCVAFYMPHTNGTNICGAGNIECVRIAQRDLRLTEITTEIFDEEREYNKLLGINKCRCLPACNSLAYNAETYQTEFDWEQYYHITKETIDIKSGGQLSFVSIFFKDTHFIPSFRSELFGQTDFIANCGGLLGLFMGFSFISLIEIVYFLTLRIWCNIAMHSKRFWPQKSSSKVQFE